MRLGLSKSAVGRGIVWILAVLGTSAATVDASTMHPPSPFGFTTTGWIGSPNGNDTKVISFAGMDHTSLYGMQSQSEILSSPSPVAVNLGAFRVYGDLFPGVATTHKDTPFRIYFDPDGGNGLVVTGVLNGTVTGSASDSLTATFKGINPDIVSDGYDSTLKEYPFNNGDLTSVLILPADSITLRSSGSYHGVTPIGATVHPVPEPGMFVMFSVIAGFGVISVRRNFAKKRR
jgi:hypothetical protein